MRDSSSVVITAANLQSIVDDETCVVLDCRHSVRDERYGAREYAKGHICNSRFVSVSRDLADVTQVKAGRNPLPTPEVFVAKLRSWGVGLHQRIVAYDDSGGNYAARLWWMCRWVGIDNVSVLDGGWHHWQRNGGAVSGGEPGCLTTSSELECHEMTRMKVNADDVEAILGDQNYLVIDARSHERYMGFDEWQDPCAGHIPGAVSHYYKKNLDSFGMFLDSRRLYELYKNIIGDRACENVIHSCGSGINACNNILAMELAGLPGAKLYPGSWSEWCADGARPMFVANRSEKR